MADLKARVWWCEKAQWTLHHVSAKPAFQCTRWTGKGGALYINPDNPPCQTCRYNGYDIPVDDGMEFIDSMAAMLSVGMGTELKGAEEVLKEILSRGATGVDLAEPGAQEFVSKILAQASKGGLSPENAERIAENVGLKAALAG